MPQSANALQIGRTTAALSCAKSCVLPRRVSVNFTTAPCKHCTAAVMGKKRRAFDDEADESEEDEISRHAEAAWLARRS